MKRSTLLIVALIANSVQAAPLTFNTALPVSQNEFIVRQQIIVNQSGNDPTMLARKRVQSSLVSTLAYGFNSKLALFATIPLVNTRLKSTGINQSSDGIGDSRLTARYTVLRNDQAGKTFRIAPFLGVKLPTGKDNARDSRGFLPRSLQSGTSSRDIFGGVVATYNTVDWGLDAQFSAQQNSQESGFKSGDGYRIDLSWQTRLIPKTLSISTEYFIKGLIELNYLHKDMSSVDGVDNINSGGTTINLVPGIQYANQRWIIEGGIQIPVSQNLNGTALENDYVARVGIRVNF